MATWQGSLIPKWITEIGNTVIPVQNGDTVGDALRSMQNDLQWLVGESENFSSVDTLAKKFYLTRNLDSLQRLKYALSFFFMLEQVRQPVDSRYDSFWAALLEPDLEKFATEARLNIVSWNYDVQLEKSLLKFTNRMLADIHSILQVYPFSTSKSPTHEPSKIDATRFSAVKLNGTASVFESNGQIVDPVYWQHPEVTANAITDIANYYQRGRHQHPNKLYPSLSFAWEDRNRIALQQASDASAESEVLIIIGYSFPFFNRKIDRALLESMKKLRQVYIQVRAIDGAAVRERFQTFRPDIQHITSISDEGQFYIPYGY